MSLDWPVLPCQPKQRRWGGPTLPLLPSSLPRAHPTDRMNNKPDVCVWGREREKKPPPFQLKSTSRSKKVSLWPSSLLLSLLPVNHHHHHLGTVISDSHCTTTHWHKYRQTMIHQPALARGLRVKNEEYLGWLRGRVYPDVERREEEMRKGSEEVWFCTKDWNKSIKKSHHHSVNQHQCRFCHNWTRD